MDGEARRIMKQLGLSDAECSVYFSLLNKPDGEPIDTVLAKSNLGAETEEAIKSLADKGVVRVMSNRLEAVEPKSFVSRIMESRRQEMTRTFESLGSSTSRLLSILEPQYWEVRLGIKPEELLEPLPSLEEMEVRTVRVIANASSRVLISAETFGWFGKVREEVYLALERGAKFRVLMTADDPETTQRTAEIKKLGIEVRRSREEWYPVRGTLGDDKELVFLIWATRESAGTPKYFRPHYTRNPGMILVFADAFEKRWSEAKKI